MYKKRDGYSDADKVAYYRAKAAKAGYRRAAGPTNYKGRAKYVTARSEARLKEAEAKRNATKDPGVISSIGGVAGQYIGSTFGGPIGAAAGSFLGGKLGHLVEKITGFGDYKIANNSIMKGGMSPPYVVNSMNKGSVIIRHREYIGDVKATQVFTVQSFPINPGLASTFPWLSQIAGSFEQFRMRGCLFEFLSTSSDALLSSSTSTALGTVNMATQYDVAHPPFTDKRSMLNHEFSNSSKPSCSFIHPIECKKSRTPVTELYTRFGSVPAGSDPHLYDLGNFQIATEGMQATGGVLGELWVTYEVELMKQQFFIESFTDHWYFSSATAAAWLGVGATKHVLRPGSTIGGTINDAGNVYSFPDYVPYGKYLCTYFIVGETATVGEVSPSLTNAELIDYWVDQDNTFWVQSPGVGTAGNTLTAQFIILVKGAGCTITFGTATIPTTGGVANKGDFWITRISTDIES